MTTIAAALAAAQGVAAKAKTDLGNVQTALAAASAGAQALMADISNLNTDLSAIAADIATPPPPTTLAPFWWNNSPHACPVKQVGVLDYGYDLNGGHSNGYSQAAAQGYTDRGLWLMLKVGALKQGEPTAIGKALVAGGQAKAILCIMWEGNQDVPNWFQSWNELTMTMAQMVAQFDAICAEFDQVPGQQFTYAWNPNVNQAGNQAAGRTQLDTLPPKRSNLVLLLDGYDNSSSSSGPANVAAQSDPFVNAAAAQGTPFWGFAEWGLHGWDDPAYVTNTLQYHRAKGARLQCYFDDPTGSFDSTLETNSIAAYKTAA